MGIALLYLGLGITAIGALAYPWVGVVAYYTTALWSPQSIWFWVFGDLRVSLYISMATFAGLAIAIVQLRVDFSQLKDKQNFWLLVLAIFLNLSYYINPYGVNNSDSLALNSAYLISVSNKILLFYAVAVLLVDTPRKVFFLAMVMALTVIYHTYWANEQYLSGLMTGPRLAGPVGVNGSSIYVDENVYAMLFVAGVPFLYFIGHVQKRMWLKYGIWLVMPLSWHAIFLTGSRGGLLGIAIVNLIIAIRSKSKLLGLALLIGLIAAFVWQGGSYMKERSQTIVDHEEDASAAGRLDAWKAAAKMMRAFPLTGVGIGNFMIAFPDFSNKQVRVTHNTFFQLASESGIMAGVAFIVLCMQALARYLKTSYWQNLKLIDLQLWAAHEACLAALAGFFVCSMFLNLATYEVFFYLLLLDVAVKKVVERQLLFGNWVKAKDGGEAFESALPVT